MKFTPLILSLGSINTQLLVHDKSSSTSQLIKGKLSYLQKLLRYFSRIASSVFENGNGGCGGSFASLKFPVSKGLTDIFSLIIVLHLNGLPSDELSSTSSISFQ